ncbi:MAG: membrane dipeptidase [Bacillota bacterium]|nr:membrane dipeptidase [Bacillota bacterium]
MKLSLIDMHCDTLTELDAQNCAFEENNLHISYEKADFLDKYTQVFALYIPSELDKDEAYLYAKKVYNVYREKVSKLMPLDFSFNEKRGAILSIENACCLKDDEASLDEFYELGVRITSLTHCGDNRYACGNQTENDTGLTKLGSRMVKAIEQHRMALDVSHLSFKSFDGVMDVCEGPVMATHSNSYKLCRHPRNLTDEMFKKLLAHNGFIGINLYSTFLSDKSCNIDTIIDHIVHFCDMGGENNLGFGCDFDGMSIMPEGIMGIHDLHKIADRMLSRGFNENQINNIFRDNGVEFLKKLL